MGMLGRLFFIARVFPCVLAKICAKELMGLGKSDKIYIIFYSWELGMKGKLLKILAVLACLTLSAGVAACGGDGGESNESSSGSIVLTEGLGLCCKTIIRTR